MRTQHLEVKRDIPVVIEHPAGFIEIVRTASKRIEVRLPDGVSAWHGMDRAQLHAKYLKVEDGKVVPAYELLQPQIGPDGELVGIQTPEPIRFG